MTMTIDHSASVGSACGVATVSAFGLVSSSFVLMSILLPHICMYAVQ